MLFDRRPNGFYAGRNSYRYIDPLITAKSKRLLIVSPYISANYFRLLNSVSKRKRVRVITALNSLKEYERLRLKRRRAMRKMLAFAPILAISIAAIIEYPAHHAFASWILVVTIAAMVSLIVSTRLSRSANIEVRIPLRGFVHEKLYISDNEAVMGSANLTHNGTHENVEQIERVTDKARIAQLAGHFEELWASC